LAQGSWIVVDRPITFEKKTLVTPDEIKIDQPRSLNILTKHDGTINFDQGRSR